MAAPLKPGPRPFGKAGWRGMSLPTTASRCYGHLVAAKSSNIRLLDGLDVAMEKLRRCAADAMQAPDLEVTDIDGSKDAAEVDKEFRKQRLNFIKRVRAQTLGRIGATAQPVNVLADQSMQDKIQLVMQQVSQQSFERRRKH